MPEWGPATDAFLDGAELGLYVVFAAVAVLLVVGAVRRVVAV